MSSASLVGVAALRALAHPARLDLLDLLRVHERLTAAECARMLGTSTKSCSYHLGVLAGQGLVVRVEGSGDGRERPWQRAVDELVLPPGAGMAADAEARTEALRVGARRDLVLFNALLDREEGLPAGWRQAVTVHTRTAVMSARQLREWGLAVEALTREHLQRTQPDSDEARPVRLSVRGFPQEFLAETPGDG